MGGAHVQLLIVVQVSHAYGTSYTFAYDWNRRSEVPVAREIVHVGAPARVVLSSVQLYWLLYRLLYCTLHAVSG